MESPFRDGWDADMKTALKSLAPQWFKERVKAGLAAKRAAAFRRASLRESVRDSAAAVCDSRLEFSAGQRENEISQLLELASTTSPRAIGEIGSARGGNLFLFSLILPADSRLISIELEDDRIHRAVYRRLVGPSQKLFCITGDSHKPTTRERVQTALAGNQFDVLFIDGDHSYEGVSADFEMYAPLVRPGGIIGFHDIVADVFQRYGRPTPSETGGVWRFWQEVKARQREHWEFVDDPEQDGFGIGAIRWQGAF
jgi:predicted O-methyltransferase YrrM